MRGGGTPAHDLTGIIFRTFSNQPEDLRETIVSTYGVRTHNEDVSSHPDKFSSVPYELS